MLGLYRDNGKENGNYYLGFRFQNGLELRQATGDGAAVEIIRLQKQST